jgi:antitoxin ParD1/3/4
MTISLPADLDEYLKARLASGRNVSASEAIAEALYRLQEQDLAELSKLAYLREEVAKGLASAERGAVAPLNMSAIKHVARERWASRK